MRMFVLIFLMIFSFGYVIDYVEIDSDNQSGLFSSV